MHNSDESEIIAHHVYHCFTIHERAFITVTAVCPFVGIFDDVPDDFHDRIIVDENIL